MKFFFSSLLSLVGILTIFSSPLPSGSYSFARPEALRLETLDVADGLPDNTVYAIDRDPMGFLWVGTANGLARFDGRHFVTFRKGAAPREGVNNETSLPNNIVRAIRADSSSLWVGTDKGAVCLDLHSHAFSPVKVVSGDSDKGKRGQTPLSSHVKSIISLDGRIFILDTSGKAYVQTGATGESWLFEPFVYGEDEFIREIAPYGEKSLLVVTKSSVDIVDVGTKTILSHLEHPTDGFTFGLHVSHLTGKAYLSREWPWPMSVISFKVPGVLESCTDIEDYRTTAVADFGNLVVFAPHTKGLQFVPGSQPSTINKAIDTNNSRLGSNYTQTLFADVDGNLWIGTLDGGLSYFSPSFDWFDVLSTPSHPLLPFPTVTALTGNGQNLFVGTNGGGVSIVDTRNHTSRHLTSRNGTLPSDHIMSLQLVGDTLWIGVNKGGLTAYNTVSGQSKTFPHQQYIGAIHNDGDRFLWVIAWGLERFDRSTGQFLPVEGMDTVSVADVALGDNRVYAVTDKGLFVLDRPTGHILSKLTSSNSPLPDDDLSYVFLDEDGHLWVTVRNGGLYRMNPDMSDFRGYGEMEGMTAKNVEAIVSDPLGHLWMGSDNGIFRYRRDTGRFVRFDQADRIPSQQVSHGALLRQDSLLYFGTPKGVFSVNYRDVVFPNQRTPVFFSEMTIMDDKNTRIVLNADSVAPLRLDHDQNFFTITLSRPEYGLSDRGTIYYRMIGFEETWHRLGEDGVVTYTNLPPGSYDFKVRYRAADAKEDRVSCLQISIAPPWWRSPLALVLWMILFLGAIYGAFRLYAARVKAQQRERQREIEKQNAQRDNEMKLRFFTNISHELRTPLSLIITPLDGMIRREQQTDKREGLMKLRRNAGSLLSLVNQLLDFRRLDMKGEKLTPAFGSLCEFVASVAGEFEARAAQEGKTLDIDGCKGHEVYTAFDRDKVRKMVNNLLSNAFKFTPRGGVIRVAVDTSAPDAAGKAWAKITVADTGCGIPSNELPHVFERFFQASNSSAAGGSGIGLHIVREYALMHQGNVSVESIPGKGTTFTILLPLPVENVESSTTEESHKQPSPINPPSPPLQESNVEADEDEEAEDVEDEENEAEESPSPSLHTPVAPVKKKILVVEDNAEFRDFLCGELRSEGFDILEAEDGREAQEKLAAVPPDIVITDIMMPQVDGIELTRWIKSDLRVSHIPVIILTARTANESMLSGYEAGADEYLSKPFDMDVLLMKIQKLLRSQQQRIDLIQRSIEVRPVDVTISSADEKMMKETLESIERNLGNSEYSTDQLARDLLMSRPSMYKKLQTLTGRTPAVFIRSIRLKKAALLLKDTTLTISEISDMVGFGNIKYFNKHFKEEFSMTPSQFRVTNSNAAK